LTVLARAENDAGKVSGSAKWRCICNCGRTTTVSGNSLREGRTVSCGCFQRERTAEQFTTHGMKGTSTYVSWHGAKQRCRNPNAGCYADYGGRGITWPEYWDVCENFLEDMGECPEGMSLDREKNDLGYSKENCRWATKVEQSNNTRRNRVLVLNGRTQTAAQWAKETGVNYSTLLHRLGRGWTLAAALDGK
jgi:hypothetical protein